MLHNAGMSKYAVKQLFIAIVVVALLAGASATAQASTDEPVHAYTTTSSGVKAGFGYGLLALGSVAVITFLSRSVFGRAKR